uniref:Uncharacterized protein AlNc14C192G8462 n=1 Tax=Albugo laibachii Nc14 TaxID=890382 RepID=F0WPY3_9STRA|nr:conserved hypothetical protein [Albugo laibachii Nc14]|eukprot:CCA23385.1 conserved hypothetical protein [Albugo laibachii Nc14]
MPQHIELHKPEKSGHDQPHRITQSLSRDHKYKRYTRTRPNPFLRSCACKKCSLHQPHEHSIQFYALQREQSEYQEYESIRKEMLFDFALDLHRNVLTNSRRKYLFRVYRDCFSGMEAVHWMLQARKVNSLHTAILRGQSLLQAQLIENVDKEGSRKFAYDRKRFYVFSTMFLMKIRDKFVESNSAQERTAGSASIYHDPTYAYKLYTDPILERRSESALSSERPSSGKGCSSFFLKAAMCTKDSIVVEGSSASSVDDSDFDLLDGNLSQSIEPLHHSARQRALAALIGGFVAEAASTSLNGVPDPVKLIPEFKFNSRDPAFFETVCSASEQKNVRVSMTKKLFSRDLDQSYSENNFTITDNVRPSSTGVEARSILNCFAQRKRLSLKETARDILQAFQMQKTLLGRTARGFVEKAERNGEDVSDCAIYCDSIDVLVLIPPLIVLYAGTPQLFTKVENYVRMFYSGTYVLDAAMIAAFILEQIILGASILDALRKAMRCDRLTSRQRSAIYKSFTQSQNPTHHVLQKYGKYGSKSRGIYTIIQPLFAENEYTAAIRENILGGGRSCRRAIFLGACFAAQEGLQCIPREWIAKTPFFEFLEADIKAIVQQRDLLHNVGTEDGTHGERSNLDEERETKRTSIVSSLLRPTDIGSLFSDEVRNQDSLSENYTQSNASAQPVGFDSSGSYNSCESFRSDLIDFGNLDEFYFKRSRRSSETCTSSIQSSPPEPFNTKKYEAHPVNTTRLSRPPPPPPPSSTSSSVASRHSDFFYYIEEPENLVTKPIPFQILSIDSPEKRTAYIRRVDQ